MTHRMLIEPVGLNVDVPAGQTLLDAALRAGIYVPHACLHGLCGTCKVQVLEGEVDVGDASPFALMDFERGEGKCLACCALARSDVTIEADIDEDPDAEIRPVRDYDGTVSRLVDLTPTAKGVFITLDGEGLAFQAGQYVNVHVPGVSRPRAFSLAQACSESRMIELNVRLVPGGEATSYIHSQLREGDRLRLSGPYGRFFVRRSAPENLLFLAGGTGLSSIKSMVLDLLERGETRSMTLIYGARNRGELYYEQLFRALADEHKNFRFVPALSDTASSDDWAGERGFVHDVAKRLFNGDFRGLKAYLCGPPPMIDACVTTLMRGRLFERDMFMEKFLSAADAEQVVRRSPLFKAV